MWLHDYRHIKEEYDTRVAEAEARRRESELAHSAKSRRQTEQSRLASLFRFLQTH
jgi:hypothetical protein